MKIKRWFKGVSLCNDQYRDRWQEEGAALVPANCLYTQAIISDGATVESMQQMAAIIERHFSSRCLCEGVDQITRVIHFNNHPDTTREDVDKVLRVYTEEVEARDV